ncbi:MAG: PstS family phosphate ABC transporter substrate-binding protein [Dehalococcoidia bacterium]|nr:PstS family phosphate ABC transporter substrate-binding protein [Dehalococcoidia bacterium]
MLRKLNKKWFMIIPAILIATAVLLAGCTAGTDNARPSATSTVPGLTGAIDITGSNTVTPLSTIWAEAFMKANPGVNISVSGPGSGAGIAALINGTTDICQSSRVIKSTEIDQAKAKGVNPYEIKIAGDALAVVVNPSNPVNELTIAQLSAIYTNQITNWKEVGGNDAPIVVLSRDTNSGTHVFFKEHVVQMDGLPTKNTKLEYGNKVLFLPSTEGGVTETARNVNAIFYPGLAYVNPTVKVLAIKKTADSPGVKASVEASLNGTYAVSRPLLFYTNGAPTGIIKAFIDYCLSAEGQKKVTEVGYVPLSK